ncbi:MAG: N-acetyltransferase family protein [Pirellulaceae bacterium]
MSIAVRLASLDSSEDMTCVVDLLNQYAQHPMGQSRGLDEVVLEALPNSLRTHSLTRVFLAESGEQAVGIATCFIGFSTFKAKQLINIHDLFVSDVARGQGVGGMLIDQVKAYGAEQGYCAVTLEVVADNPAKEIYAHKGFAGISAETGGQYYFGKCSLD